MILNLTENHSKFLDRAEQTISRLSTRCKQQLCVRLSIKTRSHKHQTEIIFGAEASFHVLHVDQGVMCAVLCHATSLMRPQDRAVVAWTRLQYFFKCNVLGLPRNIVAKSLQEDAGDNVQIEDRPEMPHGAFELLRIRNRSHITHRNLLRCCFACSCQESDLVKLNQKAVIET